MLGIYESERILRIYRSSDLVDICIEIELTSRDGSKTINTPYLRYYSSNDTLSFNFYTASGSGPYAETYRRR